MLNTEHSLLKACQGYERALMHIEDKFNNEHGQLMAYNR